VTIAFEGEGKGGVPLDETNFLWTSVVHVAQKEGKCIPPNARFALSITNEIPLGTSPRAAFLETHTFLLTFGRWTIPGRGLGSSGAAVVSGVMIADKLFDLGLTTAQKLRYCVEIEGHPDNASASLCGGFVVCCGFENDVAQSQGAAPPS